MPVNLENSTTEPAAEEQEKNLGNTDENRNESGQNSEQLVSMTQAHLNQIVAGRVEETKASVMQSIMEKYGDLESLAETAKKFKEQEDSKLSDIEKIQRDLDAANETVASLQKTSERVGQLEEFVKQFNERRMEGVPDSVKSLLAQFDDPLKVAAWLIENAAEQEKRTPPPMHSRNQSQGNGAPEVVLNRRASL